MEKLSFKNIIKETLNRFPEYKNTHYYTDNDQELEYSFFYGFTDYVNHIISKSANPKNTKIKQAFDLFNEMVSSKDEQLSTLVVTEVFPNLVQTKESKDMALKLLNQEGRKYLTEVLKSTGVDD